MQAFWGRLSRYERWQLIIKHLRRQGLAPLLRLQPYFIPRRFQAYGVGLGKSGTHSIAGIMRRYRTAHEPDADEIMVFGPGLQPLPSAQTTIQFARQRDRRLWLEFEASHLLVELVPALVTEFPRARFVLTIRDCFSWLESALNSLVNKRAPRYWRHYAALRYALPGARHSPRAQVLADHGLEPLEAYLWRWVRFNRLVLENVPGERLLVIHTHEIARCGPSLAAFLGIPEHTLDLSQSHLYRTLQRHNLVEQIDPGFLADKVSEYCGDLMGQFFPEITSPTQARQAAA